MFLQAEAARSKLNLYDVSVASGKLVVGEESKVFIPTTHEYCSAQARQSDTEQNCSGRDVE